MLENNVFGLITGVTYCFLMLVICVASLHRSKFGYLLIFFEYFYLIGLGVFPLVASLGIINISPIFTDYEWTSGDISYVTFTHIIIYALGSFFGYFSVKSIAALFSKRLINVARLYQFANYKWFYFSSIVSIILVLLYFYLVGLDVALLNASFARSGDFSGLTGFEQYNFIKTLSMIGLFSVISLPFIIAGNRRLLSSAIIIVIMAILLYMQSVARVIFIDTVFLFALFYYSVTPNTMKTNLIFSISFLFLLFVAMYGKEFVGMFSMFLYSDGDFKLVEKYDDLLSYLFSQFGHLIYSVDAGVKSFYSHGPIFPDDILLSPIGFLPSPIFSTLNLDSLSYQLANESQRLSCINTTYFTSADKCSMPPYITGFSAYFFPIVGGFIFGFVRFFIYRILENSWIGLKNHTESLWIVIATLLVMNRLMLFIPNTISFAVFSVLVLLSFIMFNRIEIRFIKKNVYDIPPHVKS